MKQYLIEKLSEINKRIAKHEGNANARLASEARRIKFLPTGEIPEQFRRDYMHLLKLIENEIKELPDNGLMLSQFMHIQNRTAAQYINLLICIEEYLKR